VAVNNNQWHKHSGNWDHQYNIGEWNYWESDSIEMGRYSLIAVLLRKYFKNSNSTSPVRVLDVGCGTGLLLDYIPKKYHYLGIDFSSKAIEEANRKHQSRLTSSPHAHASFVQTSVENFTEAAHSRGVKFDAIIFNEVLYYVSLTELPRYATFLSNREGGAYIITSNYLGLQSKRENANLHEEISKFFPRQQVDHMSLSRPADGLSFNITSYKARGK
jgi:2-polyprenyl-3-methyl-5-hydroxy-6-metoxy-1,4-benzoquinol methylase